MGELGTYKPFDYPRVCDVCGNRRRISTMVKKPGGVWVCDIHTDERTAVELDRLNAKQKPYNIIPVPNAKPESQYPDVMEAEEAIIMNLVARMTSAGTRYETVVSGMPTPISGHMVEGLSWSARYLYTIITDSTSPARVVRQAKAQLLSIATQLMSRQQGFGISTSSTKANDAFCGGFLDSGASVWNTEDAATAGLALLYAYRVFGTLDYIVSARAAASYLRNVQAIGSNGTQYTSSDSGGTARLYTGGLASRVSNNTGFYSDHAFYPSSLLALLFWNELKTTDGDQSIGTTGTPTGFTTAAAQLLSTSMTDLRNFWTNGVLDSAGATITGLSATTPREFFNAYPASKSYFSLTGTGRWEFTDGGASTGTQVSGLNFAKGISSLYAYEGTSSQVTAVDDWLQTFQSNATYETADDVSARTLARATTGDYSPTTGIATLLTVRDSANSYAAIAKNGSSLYDWGAFGLLSPLWSVRHGGTFPDARKAVFGSNQRLEDGIRGDGDYIDWKSLRGLSGLTYQTYFVINLDAVPEALSPDSVTISTAVTSPPTVGLVFWVEGDYGLSTSGGRVSAWDNKVTSGPNPGLISEGSGSLWPYSGLDTLNGVPGVTFPNSTDDIRIKLQAIPGGPTLLMKDRNGVNFGYGAGETQARTIVAVIRPSYWAAGVANLSGGCVCRFGVTPTGGDQDWESFFFLADNLAGTPGDYLILFSNNWPTSYAAALYGPATTTATYNTIPVSFEQSSTGFDQITTRINGTTTTMTPSTMAAGVVGHPANANFILGTVDEVGSQYDHMHGSFFLLMVYDHELSASERTQKDGYINYKFGIGPTVASYGMVNDVARASMFGLALHQNPVAQAVPS